MLGLRVCLVRLGQVLGLGLALAGLPAMGLAQDLAPVGVGAAVLVIDQDRLFAESAFGRASLAREAEVAQELETQNAAIQAALVAEEQELTLLRKTLSAEDFAARAEAFDQKVERIRGEQDAKARDLGLKREEDVRAFVAAVRPILGEILQDREASVILDRSSVILSLNAIDVTDDAIARIDAVLGDQAPVP